MANNKTSIKAVKDDVNDDINSGASLFEAIKQHLYELIKVKATNSKKNISAEILAKYLIINDNFNKIIVDDVIPGKTNADTVIDSISGILGGILNNLSPSLIIFDGALTESEFNNKFNKLFCHSNNASSPGIEDIKKFIISTFSNMSKIISEINVLKQKSSILKSIEDIKDKILTNKIDENLIQEVYDANSTLFDKCIINANSTKIEDIIDIIALALNLIMPNDASTISIVLYLCMFYSQVWDFYKFVESYLFVDEDIYRLFETTFSKGSEKILKDKNQDEITLIFVISSMIFGEIDLDAIDMSFDNMNSILSSIFGSPVFGFTLDEIKNYK